MARRTPAAAGALALLLVGALGSSGCEQVLGVDFAAYKKNLCSPIGLNTCVTGQGCRFDIDQKTFACLPEMGRRGLDQPCTDETNCAAGYACATFGTGSTAISLCEPYCVDRGGCLAPRLCHSFMNMRYTGTGEEVGVCGSATSP
jgi:hypothetical protein